MSFSCSGDAAELEYRILDAKEYQKVMAFPAAGKRVFANPSILVDIQTDVGTMSPSLPPWLRSVAFP